MSPEEAASTLMSTDCASWPNGEIWAVDTWLDGHRTYTVVGNWITGETWGRPGR
jgi:hypothetical protein